MKILKGIVMLPLFAMWAAMAVLDELADKMFDWWEA